MTLSPKRACAHAKDEQQDIGLQDGRNCDPDYLDDLGDDDGTYEYLDRMRKLEFQRQPRSIRRLNGAHA